MERKTSSFFPSVPLFLLLLSYSSSSNGEENDVAVSLLLFLQKLSGDDRAVVGMLGWNASSDPCTGGWKGVMCNENTGMVRKIVLEGLGLNGSIDAALACKAPRLAVLSLHHNALQGQLPAEISACGQLTHLLINGNRLSGGLPSTIVALDNLRRLDISDNDFSGELPSEFEKIGLMTFIAQNNRLTGSIPGFDFQRLEEFNVSNNLFTGPIPGEAARFGSQSFSGNPALCGEPLNATCSTVSTPTTPSQGENSKSISKEKIALIIGYTILGFVVIFFVGYLIYRRKKAQNKDHIAKKQSRRSVKPIAGSSASDVLENRSEYSINSIMESPMVASALVVLKKPPVPYLSFQNLLKAPAELLGKGKHGSLYKVLLDDGTPLAVKRVRNWGMSGEEFSRRMARIDPAKHLNVLPVIAFYCSKQEKLVVYEYLRNGSVFKLLHGSDEGHPFSWSSRLNVAAGIANGLAFMHSELDGDGIGHGNLKTTNILLDDEMNPRISEYGLTGDQSTKSSFSADVHCFGVILLELLTGKAVQNSGAELAQWVKSVVREEWTMEVFDKLLMEEPAGDSGMVSLLKVALKCMEAGAGAGAQPSMSQVAAMINGIKDEEEDRSIVTEV